MSSFHNIDVFCVICLPALYRLCRREKNYNIQFSFSGNILYNFYCNWIGIGKSRRKSDKRRNTILGIITEAELYDIVNYQFITTILLFLITIQNLGR